jgi:hypothetical protein
MAAILLTWLPSFFDHTLSILDETAMLWLADGAKPAAVS